MNEDQLPDKKKDARPLSPRLKAKFAGEAWYMPEKPCSHCGTVAKKRVNNGECQGCSTASSKAEPIHRLMPDMVISRGSAITANIKTYRTGEKCKYGHAGWRWVSTRGCLTCQGRD